jgi:hypothetical protein
MIYKTAKIILPPIIWSMAKPGVEICQFMASNALSAEALTAHCEAFSRALDEHYVTLNESHVHIKTKHE